MGPEKGNGGEAESRARRLRFRSAFYLSSLVALSIVVTLPFSVESVVDDILGPVTGRVVKISRDRPDAAQRNHTKLHMAFVSIDETELLANIRVSGHHSCVACDWSDRVLFVAVTKDDLDADGMPPSIGVTLPQNNAEISELIQLPVRGHPLHPAAGESLYMTAVDLALSMVIIFTLGAITVRAMIYVHDEAGIGLFRRRGR